MQGLKPWSMEFREPSPYIRVGKAARNRAQKGLRIVFQGNQPGGGGPYARAINTGTGSPKRGWEQSPEAGLKKSS